MDSVIFDIDGTLADLSHRLHHIKKQPKDWDSFFAAAHLDQPIWPVLRALYAFRNYNVEIVIASGRPERTRKPTLEWLQRWAQIPKGKANLYMRPDGDRRDDQIIKREILAKILADGFKPFLVFDDRQRVVDMWRSEGLKVAQVEAGDF